MNFKQKLAGWPFAATTAILISGFVNLFAQESSNNPHAETVNRYHTSPKAGEIFRQGNVPVNLSGGQIQYSIPIYTIKVGDFQWPVSLNYGYNGLLLEGKASEVGLGWSLSGSGAVVRQVRGLPDEHMRGYWGASSRRSYVENFVTAGDIPLNVVKDFVSGMYDSEPDKFSVSAGGLSFSFFVANLGDPGVCPYSAYYTSTTPDGTRVCFSTAWDRIEVTDANGIIYSFGARELNEFTSSHWENELYMETYPSSWFLDEIRLPNGRSLHFGYGTKPIQSTSYSESLNRTASALGETIAINCGDIGGLANTGYAQTEDFREISYSSTSVTTNISANYLDGIGWDEGSLVVNRGTGEGANELPRISGIDIKDVSNVLRHKFAMSYDLQARPLLASIVKDTVETYSFEYNRLFIPFPTSAPYSQDFWGFANGRPNVSAIPEKGGNRTPNFVAASQGALTKIVYPTGGVTEVNYESNSVKVAAADYTDLGPPAEGPNLHFGSQNTALPLNEWYNEQQTLTITKPVFAMISHGAFINGTSTVLNISFGPNVSCTPPTTCGDYQTYSAFQRSLYPGKVPSFLPTLGVGLTGDVDNSHTGINCGTWRACSFGGITDWILMMPGTYTLTINAYNTSAINYFFNLDYYDPDPLGTNPPYFNVNAAGIRVASTKDCPDETLTACVQKSYVYEGDDGLTSGVYLSKIDYSYPFHIYDAHDCRNYTIMPQGFPLFFEWNMAAISYNFRTLNSLEFHAGSPVYYNRVEVHEPGKGKEIQYFHNSTYGLTGTYPYTPLPENPINGAAYKKQSIDATSTMVREVELENNVATPAVNLTLFPDGLVFGIQNEYRYTPVMDVQNFLDLLLTTGYSYARYEVEKPSKLLMMNEKDKYFPVQQTKETIHTYNTKLFPSTSEVIDSKGKSSKRKFYYPYDLVDVGYTELQTINKIGSPVKTEEYYDNVLLKSKQTYFQKWYTTPKAIVEPQRIETTQGGATTVEATINAFSPEGNLLEVTPRSGAKGALLWGYNKLFPIAEVKNAAQGTFAYTSFEESGNTGGWTYTSNPSASEFKTGMKSHMLNGNSISRSGLTSSTTYLLTFWAKGGIPSISGGVQSSNDAVVAESDGWRYFEKTITGITSLTVTGTSGVFIDELRFYPKSAVMTTYTYKPLVGIASQIDQNSRITYYEYDGQGRLKRIKDHFKNIVKEYNYAYKALPGPNNY